MSCQGRNVRSTGSWGQAAWACGAASARAASPPAVARRGLIITVLTSVQSWPSPNLGCSRDQRVANGLHRDLAVAEDECVDAVLDARARGLRRPLDEQHVAFEDLRRHLPVGVRDVREQLGEALAHAVL